ncbi:uncharacterized protein CELE_B0001.2 [Caenorhabditis elegans]|uniref:Uncharacterized protein n=1 Tax=Caenorhabditis elegans TaxID=6239 RepID=Q17411_CAEEL|nr:Uncharacterized protein CELE_B0001.2 [Caenorhabditis elegans]CAA93451.2 Uncharacterized protein CELE_B0001.2 [Caenorhabditis elegans]|eukprot:NP_502308.2 Uncharacterized protein CELE_B0001.2 [Caenorhabditis elegans]
MLGLAAQRKSNGKVAVVSPTDGIEFDVNEDILNIHMIFLGDFCQINVENNIPISYSKVEDAFRSLKTEVRTDTVEVSGDTGVLTSGLAPFYKTKEFGDVACKGQAPGEAGTNHNIIVSRLPEEQRIGLYSKFVWQGLSDGKIEVISKTAGVLTERKENKSNAKKSEAKSKEEYTKYIIGVVTGKNQRNNAVFVTCNLTYPGTDGIIEKSQLQIGDWVEIRFTKKDFVKYFPSNPTADTPRFNVKHFEKIEKIENYSVTWAGNGPQVKIRNFQFPAGHVQGQSVEDRFLGTIAISKKIVTSESKVDVLIKHRKLFQAGDGKQATWFFKNVIKSEKDSEDSGDSENENSSSTDSRPSKPKKNVENKKSEEKINNSSEKKEYSSNVPKINYSHLPEPSPMNWQMGPPGIMHPMRPIGHFGAIPNPLMYSMPYMSNMAIPPQMMNRQPVPTNNSEPVIHKKGFKPLISTENPLVLKRAVITSLKPNNGKHLYGKEKIAFLWLLDDHKQSVYYVSKNDGIEPGHFFNGLFASNGDKWECKKYVKPLGKLMDGIVSNDSIELQLIVETYFPQSGERLNPETYHSFIGKIVDKFNKLPEDCSRGVKISIKMWNIVERNEWCWIVSKVFQSKHIQLLTEFHQAWNAPGIRKLIKLKCLSLFVTVCELFDTVQDGKMTHARNQLSNGRASAETDNKDDGKRFGWVTCHDGDFIRMVVFPRIEGQKMSDMKKNITDKNVFKNVEKMESRHLYEVILDKDGKVVELFDCPQYFTSNSKGEVEFKVICSDECLLTKNVGLMEPIGAPKWIGKLMLCTEDRPIPKKKILMNATFKLLEDDDLFVDEDLVREESVCFVNIGRGEKMENQDIDEVFKIEKNDSDRQVNNLFRTKLTCMPSETIYSQFVQVCKILSNEDIVDEMNKRNIDTDLLIKLQSSSR